jgi:hypothetical protein
MGALFAVLEELLKRRPSPATIAARFGFTPGEVPTVISRLTRRMQERTKRVTAAAFP